MEFAFRATQSPYFDATAARCQNLAGAQLASQALFLFLSIPVSSFYHSGQDASLALLSCLRFLPFEIKRLHRHTVSNWRYCYPSYHPAKESIVSYSARFLHSRWQEQAFLAVSLTSSWQDGLR